MTHVFAILIGAVLLAVGGVAMFFVISYPVIGVPLMALLAAYCIGRGVLEQGA